MARPARKRPHPLTGRAYAGKRKTVSRWFLRRNGVVIMEGPNSVTMNRIAFDGLQAPHNKGAVFEVSSVDILRKRAKS